MKKINDLDLIKVATDQFYNVLPLRADIDYQDQFDLENTNRQQEEK